MYRQIDRDGYKPYAFFAGLFFTAAAYVVLCWLLNYPLLEHSVYDSYTLQAKMWRMGRITLDADYSWLEIAFYKGNSFISFPPFPTVIMWALTFIFGYDTPSRMVSFFMVLCAYGLGYFVARRRGLKRSWAAFCAVFLVLGCNLAEVGLHGGVWNVAQASSFALTMAAFAGVLFGKRRGMYGGLIAIACAVGCRPMQAFYVPLLMWMCYVRLKKTDTSAKQAVFKLVPMLIVPALIAVAYGVYNYIRFDNPLEFGHNFLPEFTDAREFGQFSVHYISGNIQNILRLPWFEDGMLTFPTTYGFAFWLCNPIFVLFVVSFVWTAVRRELKAADWMLLILLAGHFAGMLMHASFGGVQFGTRYLIDLIPAMFCFWVCHQKKAPAMCWARAIAMLWGIGFNLYGAWWYHIMMGG